MHSDSVFAKERLKIFYVLFWGLCLSCWVGSAQAFCNAYEVKRTPGPSEEAKFCRSSFPGLGYQIDQHFFIDGYATRLIFSPRTANILCHEYELDDYFYSDCKAHGIRSPYRTLESGGHRIEVKDLGRMSAEDLNRLFRQTPIFRSTEYAEEAQIDRCLVVMSEGGKVTIALFEDDPMPLASCLIQFESFLTANRDVVRR